MNSSASRCERMRSSRGLKEALRTRPHPVGVYRVKENLKTKRPPLPDAPQGMLPSNKLEDSGYLSLNNSQVTDPPDSETDPIKEQPSTHPSAHARTYEEPKLTCSPTRVSLRSSPTRVSLRSSPTRVSLRSSPKQVSLRSSPKQVSLRSSPKQVSLRSSPKQVSLRSCPTQVSLRSSLKQVSLMSSPTRVSLRSSPKQVSLRSSPTQVSLRSSPTQVSLRSSPIQVSLRSSPKRVSLRSSPTQVSLRSSPKRVSLRSSPVLPIISFQRAVCAELARSYQQTQSYDLGVVKLLAEQHALDRVIGGQMGRDHVDVFCALRARNLSALLRLILSMLGDLDLVSCRVVSPTWQKIILEDGPAMRRIQRARKQLDNRRHVTRPGSGPGVTRGSVGPRGVLSCLQTLASPCTSSSSSTRSLPAPLEQETRFNAFLKAASSLQQHEALRCCRRCSSPARHNAGAQRAVCTRPACRFDFCTLCLAAFHGALPCPSLCRPPRPTAQGTARSKRSLRRL